MSGETEKEVSAWTIDSLRYHLEQLASDLALRHEQRFEAQEKAVQVQLVAQEKAVAAALAAQKEAVNKSEASYDKRFDAVNEFRAQLSDQGRTFLPRNEADARFAAMAEKIDALQKSIDRSEGRSAGIGLSAGALAGTLTGVLTLITIVVVLANLLIKP